MYYEERLIDGVWHWRGGPRDEWTPMTQAMLHRKIDDMAATGDRLIAKLDAVVAAIDRAANYNNVLAEGFVKYRELGNGLRALLKAETYEACGRMARSIIDGETHA